MPFRTSRALFFATAAVLTLSGCGWLQEDVSNGTYNRWESSAANAPAPPATRVMQTAEGTWLEPDKAAKPVPTATELAELNQANKRIAQLEGEISSLRNDMNMMMPALTRLAALPGTTQSATQAAMAYNDIQPAAGNLSGGEVPRIHRNYMQGQDIYGDDPEVAMDAPINMPPLAPQASPQQPAPINPSGMVPGAPVAINPPVATNNPSPPVLRPATYTPPAINVASIQGVRFGNHDGGKSRMVIDVTSAQPFTFDIDNNEKLLVVEIPGTVWNAGPITRMIQDNPLVASLAASPNGNGGTRVVVELRAPARILWSQAIPPAGAQGNRIVFDIAAL